MSLVSHWFLMFLLICISSAASGDDGMLLGVNEGSSGSADFMQRQEKYQPFADFIGSVVKKPVMLATAQDLKLLKASLKSGHFDFMLVRPSHLSAGAMRDQKYVLVAAAKGNSIISFLVHKDSKLKKPADIAGKSIVMPDEDAYPTHVGLAMLRDAGIKREKENIRFFRTQEAVGYAVETKLVDVGVVISYSKVAKAWEGKGHRILWQSNPLPYWSLIASPKIDPETVARVRDAVTKLGNTPGGTEILKKMGVTGFIASNQQDYLDLLIYLKE